MPKVMIVDDNPIFRKEFKNSLCQKFPDLILEEANSSEESFGKIEGINLIFIDIRLGNENGLTLAKKIKQQHPEIHIAILTSFNLEEYRQAAKANGADYFFVKDSVIWEEVDFFLKKAGTGF